MPRPRRLRRRLTRACAPPFRVRRTQRARPARALVLRYRRARELPPRPPLPPPPPPPPPVGVEKVEPLTAPPMPLDSRQTEGERRESIGAWLPETLAEKERRRPQPPADGSAGRPTIITLKTCPRQKGDRGNQLFRLLLHLRVRLFVFGFSSS